MQGLGTQADCMLGSEAHGIGRVWFWLRGLAAPPHELCVAQHLRDFPSHDAVL